jgi:hypothetical protein
MASASETGLATRWPERFWPEGDGRVNWSGLAALLAEKSTAGSP